MQASDAIRYQLIDIRPTIERYMGMGFVAGSVSLPHGDELRSDAATIQHVAGCKIPVLLCLSGLKAHGLALALAPSLTHPLRYVVGGLFAWRTEGLPLAGVGLLDHAEPPLAPGEFATRLYAELDAMLVGASIGATEPAALVLRRCIATLGRPLERSAPHELRRLLDLLAGVLLDFGVSRMEVSALLDRLLRRLPWTWGNHAVNR
ncbi:MAG: hypothetical protein KDK70_38405 [Myxococcales bacterium]|nr:hypothetical protein [Myxococcales bacterium]